MNCLSGSFETTEGTNILIALPLWFWMSWHYTSWNAFPYVYQSHR